KAAKEQQKIYPKTFGSSNEESGILVSACDPISETIQTLKSCLVNDNNQF
ncbi:hypothetical protein RYX36_021396, partial [Vicia faba]